MSERTHIPESGESESSADSRDYSPLSPSGREKHAGYLAFAAHEVRNPLSTALWSAELLVRMPAAEKGGARGEKLAAMCLRALTRLRLLVEDHFLIERLDTGGLPLHLERVEFRDALAAVLARRPPSQGPCVVESLPNALVSADRVLLERLLDALLTTAGQGGVPIQVSGHLDGENFSVSVQGAPPPESGLADPGRGSSSEGKGHALSLPMARRAAGVLGGELRIEQGAFVFTLPVQAAR